MDGCDILVAAGSLDGWSMSGGKVIVMFANPTEDNTRNG